MINSWNFEIYILLDTEGINKFIQACQLDVDDDEDTYNKEYIQEFSIRIAKQIELYKAGLRKFYIRNGYPKKLN